MRKMWSDYPSVKVLFDRVLEHRKHCIDWQNNNPCHDCHFRTLTNIELELGIKD